MSDIPMIPWSTFEPRFKAAIIPAGTPIMIAKIIAQIASSAVAGNNSKNSSTTGLLVFTETPKSP